MPENTILRDVSLAELIVESLPDQLIAIDREWNIVCWNHAAGVKTGLTRTEAYGESLRKILPELPSNLPLMQAIESAMIGYQTFLPAEPGTGSEHHHEHHLFPLKNKDAKVIGVVILVHDVSHRVGIEQKLQELNGMLRHQYRQIATGAEEIASLISLTGERLSEPMQMLGLALGNLLQTGGNNFQLLRIQSSVSQLRLLHRDLLHLTQLPAGDTRTSIDTTQLVSHAIEKLEPAIRHSDARITVEGELPGLTGHVSLLQSLFLHLVGLGLKYHKAGKPPVIRITAFTTRLPPALLAADPYGTYTCIGILDEGTGFTAPAKLMPGEPALTGEEKRDQDYGFAVAICRKIMQIHQGFIEPFGRPGVGSSFHCYFPVGRLNDIFAEG